MMPVSVMIVNVQLRVQSACFFFQHLVRTVGEKWDASLSEKVLSVAGFTGGMWYQCVPLRSLSLAATSRTGRARSRGGAPSERGGHERSERDFEHQPSAPSHGGLRFTLRYESYGLASY